jgi:hypothetical protein
MRIRLILATASVASVLFGAGLVHPATAVDADFVACQGSVTSWSRVYSDVVGSGPATCAWTIGGGTPATGTLTVSVDVAETACSPLGPTGGASMSVTIGSNTYRFTYLAAGNAGSGVGAEQQARRNSESTEIMVGGALAWIDGPALGTCVGEPAVGGLSPNPQFAFTGFYGPQPVPGL